jgi:Na+-driven multidrug efflux pump
LAELLLYGDTLAIAAYGVIWTLLIFFNLPISGIVQGLQPIVGCHAGAKRNEEVIRVLKASLLVTLFPDVSLRLFTKVEQWLERAVPAARLLFLGMQSVGTAFFQAIGKALPALVLWIGRQFVLLVPLRLLLGNYLGAQGIYLAFPIADFLSALFILYLVFRHLKQGSYSTT